MAAESQAKLQEKTRAMQEGQLCRFKGQTVRAKSFIKFDDHLQGQAFYERWRKRLMPSKETWKSWNEPKNDDNLELFLSIYLLLAFL